MKSISPKYHFIGKICYDGKILIPLKISLDWDGARELYVSDDSEKELPPYLIGNIFVELEPIKFVRITFGINNITDAVYYTQDGYPMPPMTIWSGLNLNWNHWR